MFNQHQTSKSRHELPLSSEQRHQAASLRGKTTHHASSEQTNDAEKRDKHLPAKKRKHKSENDGSDHFL